MGKGEGRGSGGGGGGKAKGSKIRIVKKLPKGSKVIKAPKA